MSFLSISISFSLYLIISRITCQKTYCFCCSYDLGSVYLQLCDMLYITENHNYEKLVDPSIFIPRFSNMLLKGAHNNKLVLTATHIIASMKRDWMQVCVTPPVTYMLFVLRVLFILLWLCVNVALQTGRKPSGICGAALYTAALSHGIKCSKTDIVRCSIQLVF
jgi:transcription factor IIIB subunit 2